MIALSERFLIHEQAIGAQQELSALIAHVEAALLDEYSRQLDEVMLKARKAQ